MATVFKRKGVGPWRISYFDTDAKTGRRRRREVSTRQGDKAVAVQIAARLEAAAARHKQEAEDLAELRRRGLSDPVAERLAEAGQRPLDAHLGDFRAMLEGKGNTADHVAITLSACREVIRDCGFASLGDLEPVKVSQWIAQQKRDGAAARTINRKTGALKAFTRWAFVDGRLRTNPMLQVRKLNIQTDRRRVRRALSDDEVARLIRSAEVGPDIGGMSGPDRAMLYRLAVGSGLRASELASLTPQSFDLRDLDKAKVVVEAGYSKHRRRDVLPIRRDLAEAVARFMRGKPKDAPLFRLPQRLAKAMRADMDRAQPWIPYQDAAGRVVDFHSLRHTFITRLVRAGVAPAVAQRLARHSTITLTMDLYADIGEADERAALNALPVLPEAEARPADASLSRTGTES